MSYSSEVLADSPSAYYRVGEASGQPQDSSGNGNHTTSVSGTPTYGQPGIAGDGDASVLLDGSTEAFSAPDHATLDLGDVFTLEAWVKPVSFAAWNAIIAKRGGAYGLGLSNGKPFLDRPGIATVWIADQAISTGVWTHLVGTKSGATRKLYVNGVEVSGTGTNSAGRDSANALLIGNEETQVIFFNGTLDEVAVYPTALSASRVLAHYNAAGGIGAAHTFIDKSRFPKGKLRS